MASLIYGLCWDHKLGSNWFSKNKLIV
jgi:hypothetical protein